jgi:hypothetical protein
LLHEEAEGVMTSASRKLFLWAPRVLALSFCTFLSLFALDVFDEGRGPMEAAVALAVHMIPTAALLAAVAAAWRWEWIGAAVFIGAAALYAMSIAPRHLDWILVISGPLLVVGASYAWSWLYHDELRTKR